jgi:hypothetical protein
VDDPDVPRFPSSGFADHSYTKLYGGAFYLCPLLGYFTRMLKFLRKVGAVTREIACFFSQGVLGVVYFIVFLPIGFCIRFFTDYLDVKNPTPRWIARDSVKDVKSFLEQQW